MRLDDIKLLTAFNCTFTEDLFDDATSRMASVLGRSSVDVEAFSGLARRAKEMDAANRKKDEDYDDAPDEFIGELDPGELDIHWLW